MKIVSKLYFLRDLLKICVCWSWSILLTWVESQPWKSIYILVSSFLHIIDMISLLFTSLIFLRRTILCCNYRSKSAFKSLILLTLRIASLFKRHQALFSQFKHSHLLCGDSSWFEFEYFILDRSWGIWEFLRGQNNIANRGGFRICVFIWSKWIIAINLCFFNTLSVSL